MAAEGGKQRRKGPRKRLYRQHTLLWHSLPSENHPRLKPTGRPEKTNRLLCVTRSQKHRGASQIMTSGTNTNPASCVDTPTEGVGPPFPENDEQGMGTIQLQEEIKQRGEGDSLLDESNPHAEKEWGDTMEGDLHDGDSHDASSLGGSEEANMSLQVELSEEEMEVILGQGQDESHDTIEVQDHGEASTKINLLEISPSKNIKAVPPAALSMNLSNNDFIPNPLCPKPHVADSIGDKSVNHSDDIYPPSKQGTKIEDEKYCSIMATLEAITSKLQKLDTLENITTNLQEEISRGNSRIEEVSATVNTVKSDLTKYDEKWENIFTSINSRLLSLEKTTKSWENKLEQSRQDTANAFKVVQSGIDSNSKKALEFESFLKKSEKKWESLHRLENKIKMATEKKFQQLKRLIQTEVKEEVLQEIQTGRLQITTPENLHSFKTELREEILKEVRVAKSTEVTSGDLQKLKEDIMNEVHLNKKPMKEKSQPLNSISPGDPTVKRLKEQAYARRLNIIMFGLVDHNSPEDDRKEVISFLEQQMGLHDLDVRATYRLGILHPNAVHPRPLVIKFANIKDRWTVWNNRGKIPFDSHSPIRIQEDLRRQLRDEARVLQRIAKVASTKTHEYGDVRVKDHKINIRGTWYGMEDVNQLPPELHPMQVYTPRSTDSVVFFTKNSPFSNHHPAHFSIDEMEFSCVEQYLALAKASLAKNVTLAKKAMDTKEPSQHKAILNQLRHEVQESWAEQAPHIILPAIRAKFQQNEHLAKILTDTYPLAMGEASRDSLWGVGMSLEHKDVMDTNKWETNGNLLGNTLAQVRAELLGLSDPPPVPIPSDTNRGGN